MMGTENHENHESRQQLYRAGWRLWAALQTMYAQLAKDAARALLLRSSLATTDKEELIKRWKMARSLLDRSELIRYHIDNVEVHGATPDKIVRLQQRACQIQHSISRFERRAAFRAAVAVKNPYIGSKVQDQAITVWKLAAGALDCACVMVDRCFFYPAVEDYNGTSKPMKPSKPTKPVGLVNPARQAH
jgi:hypothetical protein